jgi:hypothetical protein
MHNRSGMLRQQELTESVSFYTYQTPNLKAKQEAAVLKICERIFLRQPRSK